VQSCLPTHLFRLVRRPNIGPASRFTISVTRCFTRCGWQDGHSVADQPRRRAVLTTTPDATISYSCNPSNVRQYIPQMAQPSCPGSLPPQDRAPHDMDNLPRRRPRRPFPWVVKSPALEITTIPEDSEVEIFPWIKCTCFPPSPPPYQSIFEEDLDSDEAEETWIEDTSSERVSGNSTSEHSAVYRESWQILYQPKDISRTCSWHKYVLRTYS
jgi:hypothetical protein